MEALRPEYKNVVRITAGVTAICILLASSYVYDQTWGQWNANISYWTSMFASVVHGNPLLLLLVYFPIIFVNILMLPIVGIWWVVKAKNDAFPRAIVAALFLLLCVSATSYLPSDEQYLKVAQYIFGPSPLRKY